MSELCELYLTDAEAGRLLTRRKVAKKANTLLVDRGRIVRHINPLIGRMKVASVTRDDIETFMHNVAEGKTAGDTKTARKFGLARVRGGKATATRVVASWAEFSLMRCGMGCAKTIPCKASPALRTVRGNAA